MKEGRSPRELVEAWPAHGSGTAIPAGLLELCRIGSDVADQRFAGTMATFIGLFSDVLALHEQASRMREAGWIPHPVLPIGELIGPEKEPAKIRAAIDVYVANNRLIIYEALRARFDEYSVESYACCVGKDAVAAHRAGLHTLIVPAVFPEIERCARATLGLGANKSGKAVIDRLVARMKELPLSDVDAFLSVEAIKLMDAYMYEGIQSSKDVERFQDFPHRHGSQHGLSEYQTSRDGLNGIFLLDFVILACTMI